MFVFIICITAISFLTRFQERDVALERLKRICDAGFISVLDFWNNPLRIFAAHELAAIIDPAMTTKMTVQFNLFGGTILKLGTERHHKKLLKGIDTLDDVGCFGLTELGYGKLEWLQEYFIYNADKRLNKCSFFCWLSIYLLFSYRG